MSVVTVQGFSLNNWGGETSGLALEITVTSQFVDSTQVVVQQNWKKVLTPSVSGTTLTFSSFTLYSTGNAFSNQGSSYNFNFTINGQPYRPFLQRMAIPTDITGFPTITIQDLIVRNRAPRSYRNDLFTYSREEIDLKILYATSGGIPASPTTPGIAKLSVASATPTDPVVIGTNDPRIPELVGRGGRLVAVKQSEDGLRYQTVGTGVGDVILGDDARLTNSRTPSGSSNDGTGDLLGDYPYPQVGSIRRASIILPSPAITSGTRTTVMCRNEDFTGGPPGVTTIVHNRLRNDGTTATDSTILAATDPRYPVLTGNANKVISVNSGGNGLTYKSVGTTSGTLAAGDDSRFSDSRTPTGVAGGDLDGSTYPNPVVSKLQNISLPSVPTGGNKDVVNVIRRSGGSNSYVALNVVTDGSTTTGILGAGDPRLVAVNPFQTGMIMPWLASTPPTDWVVLNGQTLSRTTEANLFNWATSNSLIGASLPFGVGDGSTTFTVPDFRDRAIVGRGASVYTALTGGNATVTLTTDNLPAHTHNFKPASSNSSQSASTNADPVRSSAIGTQPSGGSTLATESTGNGNAFPILPPYLSTVWIMKK